ncbi:MAG: 4-(cytidine 5'-diphospho)-2-C-methyl-D-erythritol kinase, partial [Bacteroidales bacterium]|nr:4-(cytidine 5'-diphospho)-2-C-methyl-D-erythritol kinase [Bacteroidales bacterium]
MLNLGGRAGFPLYPACSGCVFVGGTCSCGIRPPTKTSAAAAQGCRFNPCLVRTPAAISLRPSPRAPRPAFSTSTFKKNQKGFPQEQSAPRALRPALPPILLLLSKHFPKEMIVFPHAKINLGLYVTSRRTDGYHNIQSLLLPIPLHDVLELIPSPDGATRFTRSGLSIDGNPDNDLVMQAWRLLLHHTLPPVHIHLHKVIPSGAGLGGGSSDAAFLLRLANDQFQLGLSTSTLQQYAATLGMDCPFFINSHAALATERGDQLTKIDFDLTGKTIVIVKPDCHISTRQAYAAITPARPPVPIIEAIRQPVSQWMQTIHNDFEPVAISQCPEISNIKTQLLNAGAAYAAMTGSGSAVFGLFDEPPVHLTNKDFSGAF